MVLYTSIKQIRVDKSNPLFIKQLRNNLTLKIPVLESISGKTTGRVIAKTQLIKQFRLVFVNNDEGRKNGEHAQAGQRRWQGRSR